MTVKTAISLEDSLFEKVEALMKELQISRSRLFALAVQEFIERHENRRLLAALNAAYDDFPDEEERATLQGIHKRHQGLLASEQ
ncbi:hypothetical protein KFU94_40155 [Chloroflexi bacterium TSY]|nr:hypothetical protein [Chloroflexi bacterium TSY]